MNTRQIPASPGRFSELSTEQCYQKLAETDVGRVGMCTAEGPMILPVNYMVEGESILVRTAPYTLLADYAVGPMAFEVDRLEPALRFGWSVLVVGHAMPVEELDE
nr:pyridoxamine 5'-phosphate oxidase family protein [Propionibacteriales bacterium]